MYRSVVLILHALLGETQEKTAENSHNHSPAEVSESIDPQAEPSVKEDAAPKSYSTWWSSLVRIMSGFFALLAVCCFGPAISYTMDNFINVNGRGDWPDGFALVSPLLALLLNPAMLLRNLFRGRQRHTLVRIGLDTLIAVIAVPALVFVVSGGIFWYWRPAFEMPDGSVDCSWPVNTFAVECAPIAYRIGHLQIAGAIFLTFVTLCHVLLASMGVGDALRERRLMAQRRLTRRFEMEDVADKEHDV